MVATERPADHVLRFGKHHGKSLGEVPTGYLEWLSTAPAAKPRLRALAKHVLENGDEPDDGPDPDPRAADVVLPNLIWHWLQAMRRRFADDPLSLAVVEDGFGELKKLCSELTGRRWPTDAEVGIVTG
ncbi:MAG: hypothetical protein C0501_30560 [Isosphaera sp.]|nr:hypothetical protein [Isosphaera sp.]